MAAHWDPCRCAACAPPSGRPHSIPGPVAAASSLDLHVGNTKKNAHSVSAPVYVCLLTYNGHLAGGYVRRHCAALRTDWYLQWGYIEGGHIILAAPLILIANHRFTYIFFAGSAFLLFGRLAFAIVEHEYQCEN